MDLLSFLDWLDRQPTWRRHMLLGAGFVLVARGAWLAVPLIGLILVLARGVAGLILFGQMLAFVALVVAGGAMAGLAYTAVGHRARQVPIVGPSLAGIATGLPYVAVIAGLLRYLDPEPPEASIELFAFGITWVFLGSVFGWILFRE